MKREIESRSERERKKNREPEKALLPGKARWHCHKKLPNICKLKRLIIKGVGTGPEW